MQRYDSQEPDKTVGISVTEVLPCVQSANKRSYKGYSLAHCPSTTVWSYYNSCPARAKRFASAMKSLTSSPGQSTEYLAKGYSWHSLPIGSKVIDMGGSEGHVSIAIAQMHKHLHFVVQDLPDVIDGVHLGHAVEDTTRERIRFIAHDFLKNQTVEGDVFLFRWVLHDWPDKYVVEILRNLIPVLKKGNKIVVNDQIIPGPGQVSSVIEKQIRLVLPKFQLSITL